MHAALFAQELGGDVSFSTSTVYHDTLLSLITTPALVHALKLWLGVTVDTGSGISLFYRPARVTESLHS